jgi:hypothetical protein
MFAQAKLAKRVDRVKPESHCSETSFTEPDTGDLGVGSEWHKPGDLNYSNRPVRTRMAGGVAGSPSYTGYPYADCSDQIESNAHMLNQGLTKCRA